MIFCSLSNCFRKAHSSSFKSFGEHAESSSARARLSFETGISSIDKILNSITLLMGDFLPDASNFNVSVHSDNAGQAGILVGALSGNTDPETAGQYVYTASDIILNSTTTYWIFATSDSGSPNMVSPPGGYAWQMANSLDYISADGWNINTDGNSSLIGGGLFQFAVNAKPVPEPGIFGLLALAGLLLRASKTRFLPNRSSAFHASGNLLDQHVIRPIDHRPRINGWRNRFRIMAAHLVAVGIRGFDGVAHR